MPVSKGEEKLESVERELESVEAEETESEWFYLRGSDCVSESAIRYPTAKLGSTAEMFWLVASSTRANTRYPNTYGMSYRHAFFNFFPSPLFIWKIMHTFFSFNIYFFIYNFERKKFIHFHFHHYIVLDLVDIRNQSLWLNMFFNGQGIRRLINKKIFTFSIEALFICI